MIYRKAVFALAMVLLLAITSTAGAAADNDGPGIMFILDASGSMWGQVDGKAKIDIAKEVLRELLEEMPEGLDLGLTAYGHRRKGDCEDVEKLVPLGPDIREIILESLSAIQPKGKTPIALSITRVAEELKAREAETTIILISDGKETCGGEPCETVKELKKSGLRFVMHVVGFDTGSEEFDELNCIATEGGGEFHEASDAESLAGALESASRKVVTEVEEAATQEVAAAPTLGKVFLDMPENGLKSLANLQILRDGKPLKVVESFKAHSEHPLPAGSYSMVLGYANPNYKEPTPASVASFEIEPGDQETIQLGVLVYNIAETLDEAVESVILHDEGSETDYLVNEYHGNGYYLFTPKPLPGGVYSVLLTHSRNPEPVTVASGIKINEGEETVLTLDSGFTVRQPQGADITGWDLLPAGGTEPFLSIRRQSDNDEPLWRHFIVPPGDYDLDIIMNGMTEPLRIGEGLSVEPGVTLVFDTGM